ncbi:MAG TPA: hypothetical protein VN608_10640 [Clostridia bacterium]|nr:hypothetical protein [Clostridia bacterium]
MRNKYAIARRSIWYVLRALLIAAAVIVLALGLFLTAMNVSNLYILTTEGMELRAKTILNNGSALDLSPYFTETFIQNDPSLYAGSYAGFTIKTYNYRIDVERFSVLPWGNTATFRVTERMLAVSAVQTDTSETAEKLTLPEWTDARYDVVFKIVDGRWYISELHVIELNPPEQAKPTPNMSLLPSTPTATLAAPTASPSPAVTESASPQG